MKYELNRRQFVTSCAAGAAALGLSTLSTRVSAESWVHPQTLRGNHFDLSVGYQAVNFTGRERLATTINGSLPAPTLRWKEGETITLDVTNNLAEDSSIHWHGMILPTEMDGVPGMSFAGIKPGETFQYRFKVQQSGTYWYHSHSGFQEQTGMYGAIVIDPQKKDTVSYDRDYVVTLSDWSDENPGTIYKKLKKLPHYYNRQERTAGELFAEIKQKGVQRTWNERAMWNEMRMSDRDISDVTAYTYTYLMNGNAPGSPGENGWTGLFNLGEKVRLRFINAAAMTFFDVRIPGLKMTVVASDGQDIEPVTVDEFRIGVAETYDVIVEPDSDSAYTIFAQSIDRSGYARGTLTADPSLKAVIPSMDASPVLGHGDMGMSHENMSHDGMDHSMHVMHEHDGHKIGLGKAGYGSNAKIVHADAEVGPHIDMLAEMPISKLDDPGIGLRHHQHRYGRKVLTYADIKNRYQTPDPREPSRELQLHLTGNMSRYMWSMNGVKFADADPIQLKYGERLRITLVNDTMMNHPMHLHGMWSDLETGDPNHIPRKHTVIVQPGSKVSYLVTADAKGRWAYHCHLLYHMLGMFREVRVT